MSIAVALPAPLRRATFQRTGAFGQRGRNFQGEVNGTKSRVGRVYGFKFDRDATVFPAKRLQIHGLNLSRMGMTR